MRFRLRIWLIGLLAGLLCPWCEAMAVASMDAVALETSAMDMKAGRKTKKKEKKRRDKKKGQEVHRIVPVLTEEAQRKYDYYFLEAGRLKMQQKYDEAFCLLQHCLDINPYASSALYETAQYYLFLKQPMQACRLLEQAVKYDPDNFWYGQGLANLYLQQNEQEKAIRLLEEMAERFSGKLDPLYTLLDIYNRREEYDKVLDTLNRLENKMGKSEQLSMEKFRIYLRNKDNKQAFREIESLVEEYPNDMRYQVVLGDVYLQNGKADEAYQLYQNVLREEPGNAMAMYSLLSYYEETGKQEQYEQQLDSLLLNKKTDEDIKLNVMRQFIAKNEQQGGDTVRVVALFDRIMEQESEDAAMPMLYAQYLLSKNMDVKAWPVLRVVLNREPTNTAARMTLLGEAVRKEDFREVINLCEAGVESNPDMLEFYFYLAIGYNQAERTDDALAICQKALEHITPESKKEVVSDFYSIIGDCYHSKHMNKEAYEAYDSALSYNDANIGALNNYAYYLSLERKELDKAEEMSYRTIKAEPDNGTYLDTYAWILFEKGNYAEARIYIDQAMKNGGDTSRDVVEHCGDIYFMTGDVDGALQYWKQALQMGSGSETLKRKIAQKKYIPAKP